MKIIGGQDTVSLIKKMIVKYLQQAFIKKSKIKKYAELNSLGILI